jgi:hypothetical protein
MEARFEIDTPTTDFRGVTVSRAFSKQASVQKVFALTVNKELDYETESDTECEYFARDSERANRRGAERG